MSLMGHRIFKLSYLNSNFALTGGYLNPALNYPALHVVSLITKATRKLAKI